MPEGVKGIVHCKKDSYDVYVGRPSIHGNPYTVRKQGRGEAVLMYENDVKSWTPEERMRRSKLLDGKIIACWCAPKGGIPIDGPLVCHAQVLARMVRGDYECPKS